MPDVGNVQSRYRTLVQHPVAARLLVAKAVSEAGDFVGLAALLVLAYGATGSVLGPAAVLAARSLPALAVAILLGAWLDQPSRRASLVTLSLLGGLVIAIPAARPSAVTAIVAAGLLGAVRAAHQSVHAATVAASVPADLRLPLFGLSAAINQGSQVIGILCGASLAVTVGPRTALIIDLVSFLCAAAVFATLPGTATVDRPRRLPALLGLQIIWGQPVLRTLAVVTWVTFLSSELPEATAASLGGRAWTPALMSASAVGGTAFTFLVARTRFLRPVTHQIHAAIGMGVALAMTGVVLLASGPQWLLVIGNSAIGAGAGWVVGAQATFAELTPVEHMGQVEATMVATNIVAGGLGILLLSSVATMAGPGSSYLVAGAVLTTIGSVAIRRMHVSSPAP